MSNLTARPVRVLLVESKPTSRAAMSHMLRSAGFEVCPFETAGEALACALGDAPEVVVTGAADVLAQMGGDELVGAFEGEPPAVRAALLALMAERMGETGLRLLFSRAEAGGFEGARFVVGAARLAGRGPALGFD
jgi:CheY-like chemotaxis protein